MTVTNQAPEAQPGGGEGKLSAAEKRARLVRLLEEKAEQGSDDVALSFAQQRLWFLEQLHPGTPVYNVPFALRLAGPLRRDALQAALDEIVARHEVLRSRFICEAGRPAQRIQPNGRIDLAFVDLMDRPAATRERELQAALSVEARRPFDLGRDDLIRASLFRLEKQEHVLLLNLHHIVCDEWSWRVLFGELAQLYEAFSKGWPSPLPDLPIQYADYALWQRERLSSPILENELAYWRERLGGEWPVLELPVERHRSGEANWRGNRQSLALGPALSDALRELSRKQEVSLFVLLLAAFKALLYRYSSEEQIVIGSPVAGRTRIETEDLIGFFVNTLVLRTDLGGDPRFLELLQRVRDTTLGAYEHQELPFEKLVEDLHPERAAGGVPFLPVVFALQQGLEPDLKWPGLQASLVEVDTGTAKFDLTWVVKDAPGWLEVTVEYATALFQDDTIARMLGQYQTLLEGIIADPARRLSQMPFLTASERQQLLVDWNRTDRAYPSQATLPQLFEIQAEKRPTALAVRYGPAEFTYGQLNRRANRLAHLLQSRGLEPGAIVGLCLERGLNLITAMLGVLKAGGGYLPLDPHGPKERLRYMIEDAGVSIVLTCQPLSEELIGSRAAIVPVDSLPPEPEDNLPARGTPESAAYVIYTSGSTGRPKGVRVPQRAVIRLVCDTDYAQLTNEDRVAQASNACFDAATFEIWGALLNGAALIGVPRDVTLSPREFAALLAAERITTLFLTTVLFNQIAAEAPDAFKPLRHLLFGGETVDPKWVRQVLATGPPERLLHVYGPTETTTFASWHHVLEVPEEAATVPIGRPIANTRIYILDRSRQPLPLGVPGEIYIGGPGVAQGYLNDPSLTAERFIPDPFSSEREARLYRTGDLARHRPDGQIEFVGRRDHQVKIRGFRVELGEVETALMQHPAVREAVVVARESGLAAGKRLDAYLVLEGGAHGGRIAEVRQFLQSKLPDHMIPSTLMPLEALPLNANGKVQRDLLPKPDPVRPEWWREKFVAPRTPAEESLARIWGEVLGIEAVGVHDSFFDLGGHSLLAVRLFAEIERRLGQKLPLATLFHSPTIAELAGLIRPEVTEAAWPLIVEIQPQGSKPPFFWVHSLGGDGGGAFFYYRKLAQLLGPDQPSYGIRSPQEPFTCLEKMAAHYIEHLREFNPDGPYFLGGFCFGGMVAYEMARQLQARGCQVGLLVLLESAPPRYRKFTWRRGAIRTLLANTRSWLGELRQQSPNELRSRFSRKASSIRNKLRRRLAGAPVNPADLAELIDMAEYPKGYARYAQAHWQALRAFRPQPYPGSVTLFRARKQPLLCTDPTLGWGGLAGGVSVNIMPGTHEKMLEEPNVQILAAELRACLAEAQTGETVAPPDNLPAAETEQRSPAAQFGSIIT